MIYFAVGKTTPMTVIVSNGSAESILAHAYLSDLECLAHADSHCFHDLVVQATVAVVAESAAAVLVISLVPIDATSTFVPIPRFGHRVIHRAVDNPNIGIAGVQDHCICVPWHFLPGWRIRSVSEFTDAGI